MRGIMGVVLGGLLALAMAAPAHALRVGGITVNVPVAGVSCTGEATIDENTITSLAMIWGDAVRLTDTSCGGGPVLCTADYRSQFGYDLYRQRGCSLTTTQLQLVCNDLIDRDLWGGMTETGCGAQGFGALVRCRTATTSGGYAGIETTSVRECAAASPGAPIDIALVCGDYDRDYRFVYTDEVACHTSVLSAGCSARDEYSSNPSTWGECLVTYPGPSGPQTARYCTSPYFLDATRALPVTPVVSIPTRLEPAPPEGCSPS